MFLSMPEDGNNLLIASEAGDLDAIQKLYGQNRDVLLVRTFERDTPLHIAAKNGHPNLVKWILKKKRCLSKARNNDENTPLHEAAKSGSRDVVQIFLQLGQSYFCRYNKFGETALVIASQHGHVGIVESLLEARSDDLFEWDRSLREAAYRGYKDVVLAMLDKAPKSFFPQFIHDLSRIWMLGLEVEVEDIPETPILHVAVQGGQVESVRAMLNHRSWRNVSMREMDEYGRCAIHVAAMKGYWEIINEFMLRMSDSADIHSSDHKSVLHFAVEYNQIEVVENLLANRTPERAAEMVSRDHDRYGNTALHLAAMNGSSLQLLECLLKPASVDVNAMNKDGMSALDIAQDKPNCAYIAERLEAKGGISLSIKPKSNTNSVLKADKDSRTVGTHMLVASLIATITFAAMFQIPGGIEDDQRSIHYGAAKLAFDKVFKFFLFSNTAAFLASITVVVGWLLRQHFKVFGKLLPNLSEASLLVSILWTVVAFVTATIVITIPRNFESLKSTDKVTFSRYESLWPSEISIVLVTPFLIAGEVFARSRLPMRKNYSCLTFLLSQLLYFMIIVFAFSEKS